MVTITRTYMLDDLDGTTEEDVSTVLFSLDKVAYEIDLSPANAEVLREKLGKYVDAGTDVTPQKTRQVKRGRVTKPAPRSREQTHAIRHWAASQGIEVSPRGRIKAEIIEKFNAAH